jgi:hypothetical protein
VLGQKYAVHIYLHASRCGELGRRIGCSIPTILFHQTVSRRSDKDLRAWTMQGSFYPPIFYTSTNVVEVSPRANEGMYPMEMHPNPSVRGIPKGPSRSLEIERLRIQLEAPCSIR